MLEKTGLETTGLETGRETTDGEPVVDEAIWLDWVQRGKRRENAAARKRKIASGIAAILLAVGSAVYVFLIK